MKIAAIKKLIKAFHVDELQKAKAAIFNEQKPEIAIEGEDEGEQLTHIIAALWIKNEMATKGTDLKNALRAYTQKVRKSID